MYFHDPCILLGNLYVNCYIWSFNHSVGITWNHLFSFSPCEKYSQDFHFQNGKWDKVAMWNNSMCKQFFFLSSLLKIVILHEHLAFL